MGPEFLSAEEVCTLHLARPNPVGGDGTGTPGSTFLGVDVGGGAGKVGGCSRGSAPAPCGFVRLRTILALFPASLLPLGPAERCSERACEHAEA